ncbi:MULTISPECIES: NAD(P)-dependent oxidoreductase [Paraburkholderia]|jgi:3-hydroxyisobutyrate dehydrogenase|uniref:2-hydroxy-3-oxopropionate reductase n=1 Tax=Paraburkholderia caribensis TaxID=75105 RepID=A0A9Q6WQH5_9BURK|nr:MULTISPECIES: NAD(P)-dependent oxidoreductase [Paraburkholderia]ALP67306.1 2-hydroxy-3-oxopropionate reductase [Paraburkholderia caribensis]AMV48003.1 2-hydroxy-3-oxopropionate reductase [Paraburkholderia caribensis]AUT57024.1 2-hydroxy-3-oxopropionate reductase [Paraburkholderia caribensis]MCO4877114.1 NAD(P)-dependent oxidoreductase [Paraburkholderia caribensis]MDR6381114.1 3-hydroxyisobutyrate dehydrogenase [Paraburkholderia caribensis]
MTQKKRIGFIGLGMMGAPMVQCLVNAGFDLYIDDADAARADTLAAQTGAQRLTHDNAAALDALITMLPNSAIVESVLLGGGHDGWASRLAKGAVVIDMSSSEPERSRKLGAALEERGLAYLDAPVSGGVKKAKEGTLAILVGGRADVLAQYQPVLEAMGKNILHIGGAGSGHAAKALNNYVSAAGLAATVEALLVAQRFGIEPEAMTDVLNASSGRSNTSENKVKQFMLSGTFASGFALQLMNKDLKIAHALAQSVGYPMTLGDTVTAVWSEAAQRSTPATDHTEMYRLLDRDAP